MKIEAMAHLFENQSPEPVIPLPEQLNTINMGLANIIYSFSDEIVGIRNDLEKSTSIKSGQTSINKVAICRTKSCRKTI